jgi:hypothetical protein
MGTIADNDIVLEGFSMPLEISIGSSATWTRVSGFIKDACSTSRRHAESDITGPPIFVSR